MLCGRCVWAVAQDAISAYSKPMGGAFYIGKHSTNGARSIRLSRIEQPPAPPAPAASSDEAPAES